MALTATNNRIAHAIPVVGQALYILFAVIGILFFTQAFTFLFRSVADFGLDEEASGGLGFQLFGLAVQAVALGWVLLRLKLLPPLIRQNLCFALVVLVAVFSVGWSIDADVTMRRSFALVGTIAFGIFLAVGLTQAQQRLAFAISLTLFLLGSYAALLLVPEMAVHHDKHMGAWRGLLAHKNGAGWMMALISIFYFYQLKTRGEQKLLYVGLLLLALLFLVMTQSVTAWLACIFAFVVMALVRFLQQVPKLSLVVGAVLAVAALVAGALLVTYADVFLGLFGRDASLTGRTGIWQALIDVGAERPLLGHGYRAFWGTDFAHVAMLAAFYAGHAHNGYLDMWIDLGYTGLVLYTAAVALVAWRLLPRVVQQYDRRAEFYLVMLAAISLIGFSGAVVLRANTIYLLLLVMALVYASPAMQRWVR